MPKTTAVQPTPTEQTWLDHLKRWGHEGRTLADYARSNGLKIPKFYAWKARLEARGLWKTTSVSFLPVTVQDTPTVDSGIRLKLPNGVTLEFHQPLDAPLLTRLVELAVSLP